MVKLYLFAYRYIISLLLKLWPLKCYLSSSPSVSETRLRNFFLFLFTSCFSVMRASIRFWSHSLCDIGRRACRPGPQSLANKFSASHRRELEGTSNVIYFIWFETITTTSALLTRRLRGVVNVPYFSRGTGLRSRIGNCRSWDFSIFPQYLQTNYLG